MYIYSKRIELTYHRINTKKEEHNEERDSPEVRRGHHRHSGWVRDESEPWTSPCYLTHGNTCPLCSEAKHGKHHKTCPDTGAAVH